MSLYLDSAVLAEVAEASELGLGAGVTTNPTLVRRAEAANRAQGATSRAEVFARLLLATRAMGGLVFAQVRTGTVAEMRREARELRALDVAFGELTPADQRRLAIKIPCTVEGLKLTRQLAGEKVPTLVTAVYTPAQAYLAAEAGATMIAPYVNRWEQANGRPGAEFLGELKAALTAAGGRTQILAASLKSVEATTAALLAGADHVTVPLEVLRAFPEHPLTAQALARFDEDYDAYPEPPGRG
ncbi:MAG: transaldolase family protein [Chitinophagales bacterium]